MSPLYPSISEQLIGHYPQIIDFGWCIRSSVTQTFTKDTEHFGQGALEQQVTGITLAPQKQNQKMITHEYFLSTTVLALISTFVISVWKVHSPPLFAWFSFHSLKVRSKLSGRQLTSDVKECDCDWYSVFSWNLAVAQVPGPGSSPSSDPKQELAG